MSLSGSTNEEKIWNFLKGKGLNDYGTAGLMGNLYAESALNPQNLQNSYESKLGYTDATYTAAVDNGSYSNFAKDSAGYGLAQWTYSTRKQNFLAYARQKGKSIGDLETQLEFLYKELSESYKTVLNTLKSATSVLSASNVVLMQFEKPADQGSSVQQKRAGYGQTYYEKYAVNNAAQTTGGSSMATKYIVAARIDENGKASGGTAGDQTGKEVMVQTLSSSGSWTYILRPPAGGVDKMVKEAYNVAANDKIGYDQNQRTTLYTYAKAAGWDLSKITTACECDCSALIAVLACCAGYSVSKDIYTGNEVKALTDVGFTKKTYSESALKVGDVLWRNGHTAIYVGTSTTYSGSTGSSSGGNTSYSGKGIGTATAKTTMNIRAGAGTNYSSYGTITKGTAVEVLEILTSGWYKIVWPGASCGYAYTSNANGTYYTYKAKAGTTTSTGGIKTLQPAQSGPSSSIAGTYRVTASALNLRYGPDADKYESMIVMLNGATCRCYGYYTTTSGVKWLLVQYTNSGKTYTGFCSSEYLKKS